MESKVPNLDAMVPDDLWKFWTDSQRQSLTKARAMFPDRPKHFTTAFQSLRAYAVNRATAMKCRLDGNITAATVYENICDSIYERLPKYARW